jgi:type II secretory pathway pseudopilin PulG
MKPSSSQAGYNLVMIMVLLTVMTIAIAAALPSWSSIIRRDKEEELIFRGLQYAEAIRVFQNRFQRPPIRLEELIEVEPRSIRRLWKDPMTDNGKWALIPLQGPTQVQVQPGIDQDQDGMPGGEVENGGGETGEDGDGGKGFGPKKGEEVQVGPFKGVHSRSGKSSYLVFNGRDRYDEWHFTVDLLLGASSNMTGPGGDPMQAGGGGVGNLPLRTRWIGRPLPAFLQPPQGSGLPQEDSGFEDRQPDGRGSGTKGGGVRKPS